jgi:hypothetical protein
MTDVAANDVAKVERSLETVKPRQKTVLTDVLRRLSRQSGRPLGSILGDHMKTAFGPGKLSFDEYTALGLYDLKRCGAADLKAFVGLRMMHAIWARANFRLEFYDLIRNKIALSALLEAHGIPAVPMRALFTTKTGFASQTCLHSADALRAFLTDAKNYPLFGKPEQGFQSLGSASFARYDEATKSLIRHDGRATGLESYIADIVSDYSGGYLFQPRILPHADTRALCGNRLATVRVLTMTTLEGPRIWRACEKIPGGANAADNYWRPGNILVELDLESGRRLSTTTGFGLDMRELTHHPDSGAAICGTSVPNWSDVRRLALGGARLFEDTALIGWDIAPVDGGAVIVEANVTPDLFLPQIADRRGVLDADFNNFLQERDRMARDWRRAIRKEIIDAQKASFA